jgi:hypothetical protein
VAAVHSSPFFFRFYQNLPRNLRLFTWRFAIILASRDFNKNCEADFNRIFFRMKAKRRTEIKIETHEVTVIRFRKNQTNIYCAKCREQTPHLSASQTALVLSLSESEVYRLAEEGQIHCNQADDLWFCGNSLAAFKK